MRDKDQKKDFLTRYYLGREEVKDTAEYLKLEPELVAEMRAETNKDTEEGKEIYKIMLKILQDDYKKLTSGELK